jgi:hypothetical protein
MTPDATVNILPEGGKGPKTQVLRIADPKRTDLQVKTLMSIASLCENLLWGEGEVGRAAEVNPVAEKAAASTYDAAMAQLRNIIDDMPRWQLDVSAGDRYLERLAAAQLQVTEDQRRQLSRMSAPHRYLGANIAQIDGLWVAWLGDGSPTMQSLHGIGPSPAEALAAFDEAYLKRSTPAPKAKTARKSTPPQKKK